MFIYLLIFPPSKNSEVIVEYILGIFLRWLYLYICSLCKEIHFEYIPFH